ncbi:thioredoxin-like protein [Geopyxis carbonaria]|nr:thioredoxin-like protein [Geopyxis carbonaria]
MSLSTPAPTPAIKIYVDLVSPFAYAAHHILTTSPAFASTPLTIVPLFLSGVMAATANRPPLAVPAKGRYILHDFVRACRRHRVPTHAARPVPGDFPFNTLLAMRCLVALQPMVPDEEWRRVLAALFDAAWVRHETIADPEVLAGVLRGLLGGSVAEEVMRRGAGEEAKRRLRENTEEAVKAGAFGVPWMVVTAVDGSRDVVWGLDRLPLVAEMVGVEWADSPVVHVERSGETKLAAAAVGTATGTAAAAEAAAEQQWGQQRAGAAIAGGNGDGDGDGDGGHEYLVEYMVEYMKAAAAAAAAEGGGGGHK